ncbi:AhpC/TSA family protein [Pedobacter insulae]|uniref:Thiol-disulfide isomerase or thioredoxin n=1 Tax=Pedobacter insulae TaxID=414048 RepID=A0A1I3A8Y7_9SPHI|nr:AhpC/TSA family protein [Pedobacter insulae]SFH46498.1 Thiol-disulfide isomerase or thioredoxin [Pedobacter insulae]
MKRVRFLIVLTFLSLFAFAQKATFTISGTINWKNSGYIYLSYRDKDGQSKTDSSIIIQQTFKFKGNINEPTNAYLRGSLKTRNVDDPNFTSFFIEPSEMKLEVTEGNYKDFKLKGSKTQDEVAQLAKLKGSITAGLKPYQDAYKLANEAYIKAIKDKLPPSVQDSLKKVANVIRNQFEPFSKKLDQVDYAFVAKNPNSYLSAYLMTFKVSKLPLDSVVLFYKGFSEKIKQSGFGKQIEAEIVKLRKGSPGSVAGAFTWVDIDGAPLSLADFKGKYVLLDFWASWCIPCREGNPHLKKLYTLYKPKGFEIIGISDDDTKPEAWRAAVAQDGIGMWKHVLRGLKLTKDGFDRSNDISDSFGIHTLPTKILIDKTGKIIGRYGGGGESDEALDKKLAEIMSTQ